MPRAYPPDNPIEADERGKVMDKVILITGASSGIGVGIAHELAKAGATVVLGARRTERLEAVAEEIRAAGGRVMTRRVDVTDRTDVAAFAEAARREFGRVDVTSGRALVSTTGPASSRPSPPSPRSETPPT
jgi:NADP-dependent 3-hydroxy acid dehydrogenase YdfG